MDTGKSYGPNTDPWGTPLVMVDIFELKPLIETNCFRSIKYDSNHLFHIPVNESQIVGDILTCTSQEIHKFCYASAFPRFYQD